MSIFLGIDNVVAVGPSNHSYFEPGNFLVSIEKLFIHTKTFGGGKLFIAELKVLESDNSSIKPGEIRSWVETLAYPQALPKIKTFIGIALGYCPKSQLKELNSAVTVKVCEDAVGHENTLYGKRLKLKATAKITKSGKSFVQVAFGVV